MTVEFDNQSIFKPIFPSDSLAIIHISEKPTEEDVSTARDIFLQYGVNVLITSEDVNSDQYPDYSLVLEPEDIDPQALRKLLTDNGIEVMDGFTR